MTTLCARRWQYSSYAGQREVTAWAVIRDGRISHSWLTPAQVQQVEKARDKIVAGHMDRAVEWLHLIGFDDVETTHAGQVKVNE